MAITVRIGSAAHQASVTLELDMRKSMNGDLMIFDHGDVDIVLSTKNNKVVVFPKDSLDDLTYGAQNRLFSHLYKKGLIIPESIQAGAFYGSLEGTMETASNDKLNTAKMTLINISTFIEEERPYFEATEAIIAMDDDALIHPDNEDSTKLGEVPQKVEQGSIYPGMVRDPYSLNMLYTM
jgi:hypothetical protein